MLLMLWSIEEMYSNWLKNLRTLNTCVCDNKVYFLRYFYSSFCHGGTSSTEYLLELYSTPHKLISFNIKAIGLSTFI